MGVFSWLVAFMTAFAATTRMRGEDGQPSRSSWLRIIQINDVYELDNFPSLRTLIDKHAKSAEMASSGPVSESPDLYCVVCCGDFLAPSLLSSLDKGAAMVDILNACNVSYVCFGNHETDVPFQALKQRISQSNFQWINSNMPNLNDILAGSSSSSSSIADVTEEKVPSHVILEVAEKRVAMLGLLTEDPSLYRPGAFGGATIRPVLETAQETVDKLSKQDVDFILPLTHQGIARDRELANQIGGEKFPLILGGHDHEPYDETVSGSRIIKTGMDAIQTAVIDIVWGSESAETTPDINVHLLDTATYKPDPIVAARVQSHQAILRELDSASLFSLAEWKKSPVGRGTGIDAFFSTKNNRLGPSTGTMALASILRMGMRCECALLNAGAVRANKDYDCEDYFTWSDLKSEMPFPTLMTSCHIPGYVLQETISQSRKFACEGVAKGGYLHTSKSLVYNDNTLKIESVLGEPFDPNKDYLTTFPIDFLQGIDNHEPLLEWAKQVDAASFVNEDAAIPAKFVLVEVFSSFLWLRLGNFEQVSGGDGIITKDNVKQRMMEISGGNQGVADLMLDNVFSIADIDQSGTISALEQMVVHFVATDMLDHVVTEEEIKVMKDVAAHVLDADPTHEEVECMVKKIRDALDLRGTGSVQREEIVQVLGDICRKDLLA